MNLDYPWILIGNRYRYGEIYIHVYGELYNGIGIRYRDSLRRVNIVNLEINKIKFLHFKSNESTYRINK